MRSDRPHITVGMEVLDATEQSVGQVQDVTETTVRVRIQQDIAVPVEAIDAITDNRLVLPLHIDLGESTTTFPPADTSAAPDPYTVNVPDPSIFH